MQRRLTTILAADIAGFSRLVGLDEEGTLSAQRAHRAELVDPLLEAHGGRIANTAGDSLLVEFLSTVEAVRCAIAVQNGMAVRNADVPEDLGILYRVGINVGDVVDQDGDLLGDGVNIAARLEALAPAGGIVVSRSVRDQVRDRLELTLNDLGEVEVKNIARPVRAFQVLRDGEAEMRASRPRRRWPVRAAAAVSLAVIVIAVGVWQLRAPEFEPADPERMALALPDRPSIAVLPFANISGDSDQDYFADGITEDIITDLSKLSELFVIASNTSFVLRERDADVREIAEELGVRYILEGSVRRAEDRIRINAQLIDAVSGRHLWTERYDGVPSDVFALQDRVAGQIADALSVKLSPSDLSATAETADQEAYDAFLRGWAYYRRGTPEDYARAIPHLERAVALDANYGRAIAALAAIYWSASEERDYLGQPGLFLAELGVTYGEAVAARQRWLRALAAGGVRPTALALAIQSAVRVREARFGEAETLAREAIALDPNDPVGHEALSKALAYAGKPAEAEAAIRAAMRRDPLYEGNYLVWLGLAQFGQESYAEAARTLNAAVAHNPNDDIALVLQVATVGWIGEAERAASLIDQMERFRAERRENAAERDSGQAGIDTLLIGAYTLADADFWPFAKAQDRARLREGLRLAGVPETAEGLSPVTVPGAVTIGADEAKALHEAGAAFVDTRNKALHDLGHIPGSVLLDLSKDFTAANLSEVVGRDQPLVIYCEGPKCLRSSEACAMAVDWGFEDVYYYRTGFPSWKAAGLPVELSTK